MCPNDLQRPHDSVFWRSYAFFEPRPLYEGPSIRILASGCRLSDGAFLLGQDCDDRLVRAGHSCTVFDTTADARRHSGPGASFYSMAARLA